jgi:hypothetical protein
VLQKPGTSTEVRNSDAKLGTITNSATSTGPDRRVLHSWKEISSYMGRGIRTIQRYEALFQLPVHRPAGKGRSAVLAFTDEVDAWLRSTPTRDSLDPACGTTSGKVVPQKPQLRTIPLAGFSNPELAA